MNRFVSRLAPLLLPACMVDTPVVDNADSGVGSDRLGANLGAWCDSTCARLDACGEADDECVTGCIDSFQKRFADKNDICTEAGLRAMDCIEKASCAELTSGDGCKTRDEAELCLASRGFVACTSGSTNEGGTAGMGGTPGATEFSCNQSLEDCSNGSVYRLVCDGPGDPPECHCMIDEDVVGSFIPSRLECPEERELRRICGWPVADGFDEPAEGPPLRCGSGAGSSDFIMPTGECGIQFDDCSDGHDYSVECHGSPGDVDCTCLQDGEHYGSYQSPDGVCPYVFDSYNAVAANYACDFNLDPR